MIEIIKFGNIRYAALTGLVGLFFVAGCKSNEQAALDKAKAQAASTGAAQQIQYIDSNGDTVTTTVAPPLVGQPQQVTTAITPAPAGPKPARTNPVVKPFGAATSPSDGPPSSQNYEPTTSGPQNSGPQNSGPQNYAPQNYAPQNADSGSSASSPNAGYPNGAPANSAPIANMRVPSGTTLAVRINQHISVKTTHVGDSFSGEVAEPVEVDGRVVIPTGTPVGGRVDAAHKRGHFKGASILELRLTSMELHGNRYSIDTHDNVRTKKGKGRRTGGFIGGMTGAGMLIGGLAGGGVGLAIGGAAGAGAGTLLAGTTGNRDIEIPAESIVRFRLSDPLLLHN